MQNQLRQYIRKPIFLCFKAGINVVALLRSKKKRPCSSVKATSRRLSGSTIHFLHWDCWSYPSRGRRIEWNPARKGRPPRRCNRQFCRFGPRGPSLGGRCFFETGLEGEFLTNKCSRAEQRACSKAGGPSKPAICLKTCQKPAQVTRKRISLL
jgi:hypothetical protein